MMKDETIYNEYGQPITFSGTRAFSKLMTQVYLWMTMGLAMTGISAMYVAKSHQLMQAIYGNSLLFWGLAIGEIALVMYLSARIMKLSFPTAGLMFALFSILNGATMASIFMIYTLSSIAETFLITAGTFAAMSLVGFFVRKDLSTLGRVLLMALIGVIIATVVNIFFHSSGLALLLNYLGVLIFVGLTAYDTQKIKNMLMMYGNDVNDQTNKLALLGSLTLYLDFINLFLYLLRLFGSRRN